MCQEICSYKLDHVGEVGNSLNTKLNISPCLLLNMFMHVSSMGFRKKKRGKKKKKKSWTCWALSLPYIAGVFFDVEWLKNAARLGFVHCNVKSKSVSPFFSVCCRQSDATTASWQPVRIQLAPCLEPVTNATGPRFVRCGGFFSWCQMQPSFKSHISNVRFPGISFLFPGKIMTVLVVKGSGGFLLWGKSNWIAGFTKM